jgi:hypothetical protein
MSLSDLTAPAVNQAVEEFDRIKRNAFLKKYRFGKAKSYFAHRFQRVAPNSDNALRLRNKLDITVTRKIARG